MRILALTNLYPNPSQPHRAPFNRYRLRMLAERHPVRVIAPIAWTDEVAARWSGRWALPPGRRMEHDGLPVEYPRYLFPPRSGRRWYGRLFRRAVRPAFARALADFRPDLVYATWAYPDGWAAVTLGHEAGLPVVVQVLGSDVLRLGDAPARRHGTAEALRRADGVVAVSRDLALRVAGLGADATRVRVIYDGVDLNVFHPGNRADARARIRLTPDEPVLLFVGNLVAVKGVDILVEAAARLAAAGARFRLHLVGQGPLRPHLERLAADRGLGVRVEFHGAIPNTHLPDWYRAASAVVLPSHSEGVPNVLLEAAACGVPFIASAVGGIPEIAGLGVSRLVPRGDVEALAIALRTFLDAPAPPVPTPGLVRSREESVRELEVFLEEVARGHARAATCPHSRAEQLIQSITDERT